VSHRVWLRDHSGTWTEVTDRVPRLGWQAQENAEEGSTAGWSITFADPAMDFDVVGWQPLVVEEDASAATDSVIAAAITGAQEISRGYDSETHEPLGRSWTVELTDMNTAWGMRLMTSAASNRRAETDTARIAWLLGTPEAAMFDDVTSFVDSTGGVAMDACDYRGQSFGQVVDDCAKASGRNWWAWVRRTDPATRKLTAWYRKDDAASNVSPLSLTNDGADLDDAALADGTAAAWPISPDSKLRRDPSRVADGDYKSYDGGAVYRRRAATSTAFGGMRRDVSGADVNVKTKAAADARAQRELLGFSTQEERVETAVNLPAALATQLRAGMLVPYKATHQPGYEAPKWMRCVAARAEPVGDGTRYDVGLTLLGTGRGVARACSVIPVDFLTGHPSLTATVGNTPSQFFPYLSSFGYANDYVASPSGLVKYTGGGSAGMVYQRPYVNNPPTSSAGQGGGGGWSFRHYGVAVPAFPMGAGDGGTRVGGFLPKLEFIPVGPGAARIWMSSAQGSHVELYRVSMPVPADPDLDVWTLISTTAGAYPYTDIVVPADGYCLHVVYVYDDSADGQGSALLFGGIDWTALS
jgi:hypothetical protein